MFATLDGIAQGQSIPQIRDRIVAVTGFTENRATVIARTEIHGAAESGSITQMRFVGYADQEVTKQWEATIGDGRTRHTHILANGQQVFLNEKFDVGGALLDHPGDATGPADEIIQCRCTQLFNVDDAPKCRCTGVGAHLVAASQTQVAPGATACIIPVSKPDISHLKQTLPGMASSMSTTIFNTFMKHKITPAFGGSKIHKVLALTREDLKLNYPNIESQISDWDILTVVDDSYVAKKDTFSDKYAAWLQSPAGQKVVGPTPIKAIKTNIDTAAVTPLTTPTPSLPKFESLPPVAPKPSSSDIKYTGKTLGSHGAQVWVNPSTGEKWLFKPQAKWMTDLDVKTAILQSKAGLTRPGVYEISLNGKHGSIQYMFDNSTAAFPDFDPLKLSDADLSVLQREQIFDWMISNFDAHTDQFIRTVDGTIAGVDKGQAFKFFGKDKLDWDYIAPGNIGTFVYPKIWKAFVQGKDIKLLDPTTGPLGDYIQRLIDIPDAEFRELLKPYALAREQNFGASASKFLDDVVHRKNNLKNDFADFYTRALTERAKHVSTPAPSSVPLPTTSTTVTPEFTPSVPGDISAIHQNTKLFIMDRFKDAGGGKKVTPAWGGAKIYKTLQLMKEEDQVGAFNDLSDLQLIRVLDEQGGFIGKPKTYESEVVTWLDTPAGKKFSNNATLTTGPAKPQIIPIQPIKAVIPDDATDVLETGTKVTPAGLFSDLPKYKQNEVIGYLKTNDNTVLRAVKSGNTVDVQRLVNSEWVYDKSFTDWTPMMNEYNVDVPFWSIKTPSTATLKTTKVPGVLPNDELSGQQIWDSRFLWDKNDVVVQSIDRDSSPGETITWQIISDGKGGFKTRYKGDTWHDWTYSQTGLMSDLNTLAQTLENGEKWQATGDIRVTTKTEAHVFGKKVGDVLTNDEIWDGTSGLEAGTVIAHSYDANMGMTFRIKVNPGPLGHGVLIDGRVNGSTNWGGSYQVFNVNDIPSDVWHAAKIDGGIADEVRAIIPGGSSKIPFKPLSNISGKAVGDSVSKSEIFDAVHPNTQPGTIIATAKADADTEWRLVFKSDGYLHLEIKPSPKGEWSDFQTVFNDVQLHNLDWKAAAGLKTPEKPVSVSVSSRKSNMSGFKVGDEVTPAEIGIESLNEPVSGTIIATAKSMDLDWRIIYHNNNLRMEFYNKSTKKWMNNYPGKQGLNPSDMDGFHWHAASGSVSHPIKAPSVKVKTSVAPTPPSPPAATKVKLTGDQTHMPGNTKVGDAVTSEDIFNNFEKYEDGQIVATHVAWGQKYRLFVADGKLVQQKQTAAGAWTQTTTIANKYSIQAPTGWKAQNDFVTPQHLKAAKKKIGSVPTPVKAVKTTQTGSKAANHVPSSAQVGMPIEITHVDLTPWDEAEQLEIYEYIKKQGVYVSSNPSQIWTAVQGVKGYFQTKYKGKYLNLNEAEILRIADAGGAKKFSVPDTHPLETKVVNWLKTSAGKSWVNKTIDAPIATNEIPAPMSAIAESVVTADSQSYEVISTSQAIKLREESHVKYGGWKTGEKEALKTYTGGSYTSWNKGIRDGDLGSYKTKILKAQAGMRPSTRPMLLHRGTNFTELNDPSITNYETLLAYVGRTYVNRGFNSTSVGGHAAFHGQLLIEYEAPIGTPMAYVDDFSLNRGEREMLLATHNIYEIKSVTKKGGTTVMRVRVIGVSQPS